jgi:hypothetical protein
MGIIRGILALCSVAAACFVVYAGFHEHPQPIWPLYVVPPILILNAFCLLSGRAPNFRISKLIGLWLDAKEAELRARAQRTKQ